MYIVVTVLIFIAAVLLILIVLVQNSKGGGLAANFTSGNQALGVRKTTDFLEKATWTLSIALLVLAISSSASIPKGGDQGGDKAILEQVDFQESNTIQDFSDFTQPAETAPEGTTDPVVPTDGE